jgi:hypothetical protein
VMLGACCADDHVDQPQGYAQYSPVLDCATHSVRYPWFRCTLCHALWCRVDAYSVQYTKWKGVLHAHLHVSAAEQHDLSNHGIVRHLRCSWQTNRARQPACDDPSPKWSASSRNALHQLLSCTLKARQNNRTSAVTYHHGHRAEQGFEVVRQLTAACEGSARSMHTQAVGIPSKQRKATVSKEGGVL